MPHTGENAHEYSRMADGFDRETHRRNIFRRELVCGVGDEQAGFTHSTVPNYNTLNGLHGCVLQSSLLIQDLQEKQKNTHVWPISNSSTITNYYFMEIIFHINPRDTLVEMF